MKEHRKSPGGTRTKATMAIRVKGSKGSFNARCRREPRGGDTDGPETDNLRGSAQNADREKLNDERGIKPLAVSEKNRDGAESAETRPGWVTGRFCILPWKSARQGALETMPERELRTYLVSSDASVQPT